MIMPCMVMNWRYWFASIKENVPGNPNCSRRERVLDGDDLGVLRKDILRPPAFGVIELNLRHFGRRDVCDCVIRDIDHRNASSVVSTRGDEWVSRARSIFAAAFSYLPPDLYVALITAFRPDNSANVCCFCSQA